MDVTYVQYVGRDLSSPQLISPRLDMYAERLHEWRSAGGTYKRLSEISSHCATVNCQLWYEAEALLLPADKVCARAVCWAVVSVHEVRWRKARLWLQQRSLGEAFLDALYNGGTRKSAYCTSLHAGLTNKQHTTCRSNSIYNIQTLQSVSTDLLFLCITSYRFWITTEEITSLPFFLILLAKNVFIVMRKASKALWHLELSPIVLKRSFGLQIGNKNHLWTIWGQSPHQWS